MEKELMVDYLSYNIKATNEQLLKIHLSFYACISDIHLTEPDLKLLIYSGLKGSYPLITFCNDLVTFGIYTSAQSVRNSINKLKDKNLLVVPGKSKKKIFINPELGIAKGVLLSVKCFL